MAYDVIETKYIFRNSIYALFSIIEYILYINYTVYTCSYCIYACVCMYTYIQDKWDLTIITLIGCLFSRLPISINVCSNDGMKED